MIKINRNFIRNILLSTLIVAGMSVSAASENDWNTVYTENFDGIADSTVTEGITNANASFSAEIKDEALVMKSDALCYYRVQNPDLDSLNSEENSHGIEAWTYNNKWICSELSEPSDGVYYSGSNTNALLVKAQSGLNSLGTVLVKTSSGVARTNIMFKVDSSIFKSTDSVAIRVKYYTPDGKDRLRITYPNSSSSSTGTLYDTGKSGATDEWHTVTKVLEGADFTKKAHSDYTFRIFADQTGTNGEGMVFIHSVELYKTEVASIDENADNTVFEQKISDDQIYGNAKLTYDLTFPTGIRCAEGCEQDDTCVSAEYNAGKNSVSFGLVDNNGVEFASIQYKLDEAEAKIYALSSDEYEENAKILLYSGDISDVQLTYTVTFNMKESTYTVEIADSGTPLPLENDGPIPVCNKEELGLYCNAKYIRISHNKSSQALLYSVDNIVVEGQVDADYEKAATDLDNINLQELVKDNFNLPSEGAVNKSEVYWASNDSAIEISGNTAIVNRGEDDVTVTLLAEATYNGMTAEKEFYVTVKSFEGVYFEVSECFGRVESDGTITAQAAVMHPGVTGAASITFVVYSIDNATGKICNVEYITKAVTSTYGELSFGPVTGMSANGGNSVKCYLWDNNNKSLVNNNPVVSDIKSESKVKGAGVSWKGYDDNNAVDYYEVYRNGSKIAELPATGEEMTYLDTAVSGKNNTYSIVAVDTNMNKGAMVSDNAKCGKIPMTYYLSPSGESEAEINENGNGIEMLIKNSDSSAGYTVFDPDGRKIPVGKYIPLIISTGAPKSDLVISFTYKAEEGTKLQFLYNYQVMENTGASYTVKASDIGKGWLVFTVKLPGITLEYNNGRMNNAHFALQALNGEVIVKKIEMIEISKYE